MTVVRGNPVTLYPGARIFSPLPLPARPSVAEKKSIPGRCTFPVNVPIAARPANRWSTSCRYIEKLSSSLSGNFFLW